MNDFKIGDKVTINNERRKQVYTIVERMKPEEDILFGDTYYRIEYKNDKEIYAWGSDLSCYQSFKDKVVEWIDKYTLKLKICQKNQLTS